MSLFYVFKKNQQGFSIVEIMVATGMLTIAGLAVMALSQLSNQDSLQLKALRVALTGRASIEAALKNPAAWRQTVAQNRSFDCVTASGCNLPIANNGYYDFVLYGVGVGEKITFDPADGTTRYAIRGGNCPAGTPDLDPQCPIKFMARWKPLCQSYPCLNPTLDIKVSLVPEFGSKAPPFNPQKYEFATVRGIDDGSIQSACQILNGTYNTVTGTCYPKNAGKSCGPPPLYLSPKIVSSVAADGSITCAPLYTGQCNYPAQVLKGISATGTAQCAARVQPTNCPVDCVGGLGACSVPCGGGTQDFIITTHATNGGVGCVPAADTLSIPCNAQACVSSGPVNCVGNFGGCSAPCGRGTMTYLISTPAANGGAACALARGTTQACNTLACVGPINCVGSWNACSAPCDTGSQTFSITTGAANSGAACGFANNATRACNTQLCSAVTNCAGGWGPCSAACEGGTQTYSIGTPAANGGAACAYAGGASQVCNTEACPLAPVNCVGSWSGCSQTCGGGTKTYSVTTDAANGGSSCPSNAGDSLVCNSDACPVDADCAGNWSSCDPIAGTKTYTVTQNQQGTGAACPTPLTQSCPVDCVGGWGSCEGSSPQYKVFTWTTPPLNGGSMATCGTPNGQRDYPPCTVLVNGLCGTASGSSSSTAPTSNFCSSGSADSAPSGAGPWSWSCLGSGGGSNSSCSASVATSQSCPSPRPPRPTCAPGESLCGSLYCETTSGSWVIPECHITGSPCF